MMKVVLICIMSMWMQAGHSQKISLRKPYTVSVKAKDSFNYFMKRVPKEALEDLKEFIDLPAVIIPFQIGDTVFQNPYQSSGIVECQCAFANDTLLVLVEDGYYMGGVFLASASKGKSGSIFAIWSDESDAVSENGKDWKGGIELPAKQFDLALSKNAPFKIGETIYGIWKAEYPPFYIKEEQEIITLKNKLIFYFSCKVDYEIQ